jgi:hypothetical protein
MRLAVLMVNTVKCLTVDGNDLLLIGYIFVKLTKQYFNVTM